MSIERTWIRSTIKIAMVIEIGAVLVSLFVGMFGHAALMLLTGLAIGVLAAVISIVEHNSHHSWRLHHVELRGLSLLLMLSMLAHADRPIHTVVCGSLLVVLHCVPERVLRATAGFCAATLLTLSATVPFSMLEYYGPSASLSIVYRVSDLVVMLPFLLYTRVERRTPGQELDELTAKVRGYKMTPQEREAQRRSFAYGNAKIHNPDVTMEMVNEAADKIAKENGDGR